MSMDLTKFRIVIIDCPIYAFDDSFCTSLLGKALKMKFDGYGVTYHENILPLDKTDFIGTHIMLCEETPEGFIPVFIYRSISLARCNQFGLEFPILTMMRNDGHPSCVEKIEEIIENANDPKSVAYDSSWAQNLDYRFSNDADLKITLREITMMLAVNHHKDYGSPHMITCGVTKVKTDQFFFKIGLEELNEHAHFIENGMTKEECVIFYNNSFSLDAHRMAKKYKDLWDNKLVIDGVALRKIATAAKAA